MSLLFTRPAVSLALIVGILLSCQLVLAAAPSDSVAAARLAHEAEDARRSGQFVRAFLLYSEAASRDPHNSSYRQNRDGLASVANLFMKAQLESADITSDLKQAVAPMGVAQPAVEEIERERALEAASRLDVEDAKGLQGLPKLLPSDGNHDFQLRGDITTLYRQVASAYGIEIVFDKDLQEANSLRLAVTGVNFRAAMDALTNVTDTFLFPISSHAIFVARDTELKRAEFEPNIVLSVPLPNALELRDLTDAANAVRGLFTMRSISYDSGTRTVLIKDRVSRVLKARAVLEALLLPKAQVAIEVEVLAIDADTSYHYGLSLPTSFQVIDFGRIGRFQSILSSVASPLSMIGFGGGASLFGIGLTNANLFAQYSNSVSRRLYDATVVAGDGQVASFHVGDRYPIAQTLYNQTGQTPTSPLTNPVGQITYEDLGLVLKLTPHVAGDGDVALDVEASFKMLGNITIDSVPSIAERDFKGNVRLVEGEWAVIAGLDQSSKTFNRSGLVGLSQIPGLNQILSENSRDTSSSNTMVVIKPFITRLPMSGTVNPQYLVGPTGGFRVLL